MSKKIFILSEAFRRRVCSGTIQDFYSFIPQVKNHLPQKNPGPFSIFSPCALLYSCYHFSTFYTHPGNPSKRLSSFPAGGNALPMLSVQPSASGSQIPTRISGILAPGCTLMQGLSYR